MQQRSKNPSSRSFHSFLSLSLSLHVAALQVYVHLYDDLPADAAVAVGGFGARNTMAAYQNPASKEYAWGGSHHSHRA